MQAGITLRAGGKAFRLAPGPEQAASLDSQALRWGYVLRARERWAGDPQARETRERDAAATLAGLGLDDGALQAIAQCAQVVVSLRYTSEPQGWAARIFPWEYVLSTATRRFRQPVDREFTVLRELLPAPRPGSAHGGAQPVLLYVQSAPGRLEESWSFEGERRRLQRAMISPKASIKLLRNPTLAQLSHAMAEFKPALLHISGFDNAEGLRALRELAGPQTLVDTTPDGAAAPGTLAAVLGGADKLPDGYLMTSPNGRPCIVTALQLATALREAPAPAVVVGVSVSNSAARTAALVVGEGAALHAVGFQGAADYSFSNYLFELLYGELMALAGDVPLSFRRAWGRARQQPRAGWATGVALWSAQAIREPGAAAPQDEVRLSRQPGPVSLDADAPAELNYAVLHNSSQGLFGKFIVQRNGAQAGDRIAVDVEVQLGVERATYRKAFIVGDEDRWDLSGQVHVPLTAGLVRSSREALNSIVITTLSSNEQVVSRESRRIRLLPVDQWRDNARDGQWLPSFVLPRDPAALQAVQQAQRYVRVLRDDPTAGFEGYQAVGDPAHEEDLAEVDLQVQAIWSALLHEWRLGYINPPPGYSATLDSQRLRTPSAVRGNAAGTCIDLALLMAACLELVDIYPVIFLLQGHALVGYWRHDSFHDEFRLATFDEADARARAPAHTTSTPDIQRYAWQALGLDAHRELVARIRKRQLVPMETVRLTENCGFIGAVEAGTAALASRDDFHSLLDIVCARESGVTPLPIVEDAR